MFTRCPICQQDVPNWEYQNHVGQHGPQAMARMPVQMMPAPAPVVPNIPGYQSMPAQPSGPARQYYHPQCGGSTAMPPYALQQMGTDPFAFGDKVTCTGCGKLVAETEVFWSDSGQSLADYRQELKNNFVYAHKLNPEDFEWEAQGPVRRKSKGRATALFVAGGVAAVVGALVVVTGAVLIVGAVANMANTDRPIPAKPVVGTAAPPAYTPPTYTPPSYTATPAYTPPVYTPPGYPPGIESPDEVLARHRRESERMRAESRKRIEEMQRDMDKRMEDLRKRAGRRP